MSAVDIHTYQRWDWLKAKSILAPKHITYMRGILGAGWDGFLEARAKMKKADPSTDPQVPTMWCRWGISYLQDFDVALDNSAHVREGFVNLQLLFQQGAVGKTVFDFWEDIRPAFGDASDEDVSYFTETPVNPTGLQAGYWTEEWRLRFMASGGDTTDFD